MKRVVRFCDRHGEDDRDTVADETVVFKVDDVEYEIDLCPAHLTEWQEFKAVEAGWVGAARSTTPAPPPANRNRSKAERDENAAIRAWCATNSVDLGARGRIPSEVRERYREELARQAHERWNADKDGQPSAGLVTAG